MSLGSLESHLKQLLSIVVLGALESLGLLARRGFSLRGPFPYSTADWDSQVSVTVLSSSWFFFLFNLYITSFVFLSTPLIFPIINLHTSH